MIRRNRDVENLVVGLDIGTSKVCAIVGEETDAGVDIIGVGSAPSGGMRKGVVINIDATVNAIQKAVEEAELMAGCHVKAVHTGIAGGHIKSVNSHGIVAIKDREVSDQDIVRVLDAAQAIAIPMDREIIHIIPQEYIIDEQDGIRDPRGMAGVRLASKVHIVSGAVACAQNIVKCCHKTGLDVKDLVLEQLASAEAVLTPDERELGVMLIDIGGGTTDLAIYANGAVQHTAVLSLGGDHITRDIAIGLGTPTQDAEKIKQEYGCALVDAVEKDEPLDINSVGGKRGRFVSRRMLAEIIEPRVEEILGVVAKELNKSGLQDRIPAGVVMCGGTTLLAGIQDMAERVFGMNVRIGVPRGIGGLTDSVRSPVYATAVGLVLFGLNKARTQDARINVRSENFYRRVKNRMGEWIGNFF